MMNNNCYVYQGGGKYYFMVKSFGKPNVLLERIDHQMYQLILHDICFESKFDDLIKKFIIYLSISILFYKMCLMATHELVWLLTPFDLDFFVFLQLE